MAQRRNEKRPRYTTKWNQERLQNLWRNQVELLSEFIPDELMELFRQNADVEEIPADVLEWWEFMVYFTYKWPGKRTRRRKEILGHMVLCFAAAFYTPLLFGGGAEKLTPIFNREILAKAVDNSLMFLVIGGVCSSRLEVKNIRLLAFLLERLRQAELITNNWQDYYSKQGVFIHNGKPITTWRQALLKSNEDWEVLRSDPNREKWSDRKRKRYETYKEIIEVINEIKSGQ